MPLKTHIENRKFLRNLKNIFWGLFFAFKMEPFDTDPHHQKHRKTLLGRVWDPPEPPGSISESPESIVEPSGVDFGAAGVDFGASGIDFGASGP